MRAFLFLLAVSLSAMALATCESGDTTFVPADGDSDADSDGDADGDGDTDSDGDADSDTDGDGDTDSDSDGDADSDSDADTDSDPDCVDQDSDWWCVPFDCDDTDPDVNPGEIEIPDNDIDDNCNGVTDEEVDTGGYTGPTIPETCEQAALATTTVGCLFYAVDLDSHDSVETQQYAVAVSNVNQTETAHVTVYKGNSSTNSWDLHSQSDVAPMSLHTFNLPDYHMNSSGLMAKGSYKVVSDVPIIAYQFNPVDGASSYLSDASMLIPVTSLSATYDVIGWKQNSGDGDMRAYFSVVATVDGTLATVEPSVSPLAGGVVPGTGAPFTVTMNEGDVLEVQTNGYGHSMTGSRVTSDPDHPVAVFSGQECAFIPETIYACDHLEEQMPGLRFWGTEFVAARMPVRSTAATSDIVLWQVYASEDATQVSFAASVGVTGVPVSPQMLNQGQMLEFYVNGNQVQPGDFHILADKPIGVMQYMTGSTNPNANSIGDPAMVYTSPVEQFLPRYVVLVPSTWINDALVVTRVAGSEVLLDGTAIPGGSFVQVASSGYEVARVAVPDGIHTLESTNPSNGLAVVVVGYDTYDSYAYAGGMGMGAINPVVE
ncbi:MAG TPA: MopE-related protein [Polyangia bacterium]|nr:MopE-related protein [Polyangia bacterium]